MIALAPGRRARGRSDRRASARATCSSTPPGTRAYVITQDGVSAIDLAYATGHGPSDRAADRGRAIRASRPRPSRSRSSRPASYAAVRQAGLRDGARSSTSARRPGAVREVPLASPRDRHRSRARRRARVRGAARGRSCSSIIDVPTGPRRQTIDLADAAIGSLVLSRDGTRALLFTNATLDERITLVKLDQPGFPHVTWPLKKAVRAVGISPTGDDRDRAEREGARATPRPRPPSTSTSIRAMATRCSISRPASRSCRSRRSIPVRSPTRPTAARPTSRSTAATPRPRRARCRSSPRRPASSSTRSLGSPPSAVGILPGRRRGVRRAAPSARPRVVRRSRHRCDAHRHRLRSQQPHRELRIPMRHLLVILALVGLHLGGCWLAEDDRARSKWDRDRTVLGPIPLKSQIAYVDSGARSRDAARPRRATSP